MERPRRHSLQLTPPFFLLLLLLELLLLGAGRVQGQPPPAAPPFNLSTPLDPAQVDALQALGVTVTGNPCVTQTDIVGCDQGTPVRHVTRLVLKLCTQGVPKTTADDLRSLYTLKDLTFQDCPFRDFPVPVELLSSVTSLTVHASLGRTSTDAITVPGLPGTWLAKWYNLESLDVEDVLVNASSLAIVLNNLTHAETLKFTSTGLGGNLSAVFWPTNLTWLDLSTNLINGSIPAALGGRTKLNTVDLSDNRISGVLPDPLGELVNLQTLAVANNFITGNMPPSFANLTSLQVLDTSGNQLNGSLPAFLNQLPNLRTVDVRNNSFSGPLPFNSTVIAGLSLQTDGNPELCYNSTLLSSTLVGGLQPCGADGLPPLPSPSGFFGPASAPSPGPLPASGDSHHKKKKGPKIIVVAVATSLAAIIIIIVAIICVSRWCAAKDYE